MDMRPKLFIDTNICINVANGTIPQAEWQRVRQHIEVHYSYQISAITLKEVLAKISRGEDAYFEENKKSLRVLYDARQQAFLPYPAVFALRTVLGLKSVARRSPIPEEELYEAVCKALLQASSKAQLKDGVPYPNRSGQLFSFDIDHFDLHENKPQIEHLDQLQGMRDGRIRMPDPMKLAEYTMEDCGQTPDAECCRKLANALDAANVFSRNLGKLSKSKDAHLGNRESDWGDIMQLYYLCDESMHFLTCDEKCRNQTHGSPQQGRILLYKDLAF